MKQKYYILIIGLISLLSFSQNKKESFSFIVLGDMPYNLPNDYLKFENVIASINKQNQVFNVFVGDFKSSKTPCSNEAYIKILAYFNSFKRPLIYTPGDNEWTDCGKVKAGSYDTNERLKVIRDQFFKEPTQSLGVNKINLITQSSFEDYSKYVENKMWNYNAISFATVHIVGSNNNLIISDSTANGEFLERSKADIYWINKIFKKAEKDKSLGIVIFEHADMFFPDKGKEGFETFLTALQKLVTDYKKPVLLVNGDSHEYRIDKPFYENKELKKTLLNFTRLQVFGEADMQAVKVTINPKDPSLFEIQQFWIPQNN